MEIQEQPSGGPLDLNQATREELIDLPGIGPALAGRILDYRQEHGRFHRAQELIEVDGIGEALYAGLAGQVAVKAEGSGSEADEAAEATISRGEAEEAEEVAAERAMEAMVYEGLSEEWEEIVEGSGSEAEAVISRGEAEEVAAEQAIEAMAYKGLTEEWEEIEDSEPDEAAETEQAAISRGEAEEVAAERAIETVVQEAMAEKGPVAEEDAAPAAAEAPPPAVPTKPGKPDQPAFLPGVRFLSLLLAALVGGLLGLVMSLLVLYGLNGTLDFASRQDLRGSTRQIGELSTQIEALQGEAVTLRQRLDKLEGLAGRTEDLETRVAILREDVSGFDGRINDVEDSVGGALEQVEELRRQSQQVRTFFERLQDLLGEFFGP